MSRPAETFSVYDPRCPARTVLEHVTSRWGVLALAALTERTYRFNELRRRINGVSEKMLAQTLQTLERDGLVVRVAYPRVPPRVEYSLTSAGERCAALLVGLTGWIESEMPEVLSSQTGYDERVRDQVPASSGPPQRR